MGPPVNPLCHFIIDKKKISAWAFLFMLLLSLFPSLVGAGLVVSKNQIKIGTFRPQDAPSLKRTRAANETNKQKEEAM
jgi:predicted RND superfamily exporter protein